MGRDLRRWPRDAGADLLSWLVRLRTRWNDRWKTGRAPHAAKTRCDHGGGGRMRVFVPIDAAALALGAEEVAAAVQETAEARGIAVDIVRNGSRGMFWLEPMVEAETPQGRIAYGPVEAQRCSQPVRRRVSGWRLSSAAHRQTRGASVPEAADAACFRALRHHRSALPQRLPSLQGL